MLRRRDEMRQWCALSFPPELLSSSWRGRDAVVVAVDVDDDAIECVTWVENVFTDWNFFSYSEIFIILNHFSVERVFSQSEMDNLTARTEQGASTIHYGENENNLEISQFKCIFHKKFYILKNFPLHLRFSAIFPFSLKNWISFHFYLFLTLFFSHCFPFIFNVFFQYFSSQNRLDFLSSVTFIFIVFLLVSTLDPNPTPLAFLPLRKILYYVSLKHIFPFHRDIFIIISSSLYYFFTSKCILFLILIFSFLFSFRIFCCNCVCVCGFNFLCF